MRRFVLFAVAVLATVGSLTSPVYAEQRDRTNTDLHALTSIPGPTIAGVPAGGKAWTIGRGSKARVDEGGEVRADIHGLVLADTKTALPVTQVKASVVCGNAVVGTTDLVSITPDGNAEIRARVSIPRYCSDPDVLIRVAGGAWIAATRIP